MAKPRDILCPACGSKTGLVMPGRPPASRKKRGTEKSIAGHGYRCIRCGFEW